MKKKYMILAYAMTAVFGLYGCSGNPAAATATTEATATTTAASEATTTATTAAAETSADGAGQESADGAEEEKEGNDNGPESENGNGTETETKNETVKSGEPTSESETEKETGAKSDTAAESGTEAAAVLEETAAPAAASTPVVHTGYSFQTGGTVISMNQDVSTFLSGLGSYTNYVESKSCAFKGLDKIYTYAGFDLYTYPVDGVDYVNSIYFSDESVSTQEGIHIGSTLDDMLAAYGDGYTEEYGVYQYVKDKSTLSFIVTDNVIESIEYTAITK